MKLEIAIPTKMGKGKVLLFIKLRSCVLKKENIQSDVSNTPIPQPLPLLLPYHLPMQ